MLDCIFCDVAQHVRPANIVAEYEHCYVMKDEFPVNEGHLLIVSKQHVENWFAADDPTKEEMLKVLDAMKIVLDKEYHPDGYNFGANCGVAAGQTVMHLHVHLIPRYQGDVENPRGGVRGVIPSKQSYKNPNN